MITLYALSQMAERITPGSVRLSATFAYAKNAQSELRVTRDNSMVLQLLEVSLSSRNHYILCKNRLGGRNVHSLFVDFVHVRITWIKPESRWIPPTYFFSFFSFYRYGANFNFQGLKNRAEKHSVFTDKQDNQLICKLIIIRS